MAQFNPYAAGRKDYGIKGAPNIGPVDKKGYRERDRRKLAAIKAFTKQSQTPEEARTQTAAYLARKRVASSKGLKPDTPQMKINNTRQAAARKRLELLKGQRK